MAGAIAVWIDGRWLIHLAVRLLSAALTKQEFDPTLQRYIANIVGVALNIVLVVAILGYFGVETTSFAALVAGMGVAIGAAWAGLLSNFAAGAFLIVLRPFKVGDYVKAGGIEGTVTEIGLFATTILTPDNVSTFFGNNKGDRNEHAADNVYHHRHPDHAGPENPRRHRRLDHRPLADQSRRSRAPPARSLSRRLQCRL